MLIALACDDERFGKQLETLLATQSHVVAREELEEAAARRLLAKPPALVIIAASAQDSALDFLRRLRAIEALRPTPILCVNPRAGGAEGVVLLDAGADDFINRPFNPQIFLARARTLLRRGVWSGRLEEEPVTTLESGPLRLQLISRQATIGGRAVVLTRLEFDLLAFFLRSPERVFSRQDILEAVWNYPGNVETRTLDKHVETLRRKLGEAGGLIETVHGVGYRLAASRPARNGR